MSLKRSLTITDVPAKRVKATPAKTMARWKPAISRSLAFKGDNVHTHVRTFRLAPLGINNLTPNQALTDAAGVQATFRVNSTLGDLPNFTELASLYDEFRITDVSVRIVPRYTDPTTTGQNDTNMLVLGWFLDHNAASSATYDIAEGPWLERAGYRSTIFDKEVTVKFKPRPLQLNVNGAVAGTMSYKYQPWLSTGDTSVYHYGAAFRLYSPYSTVSFTSAMAAVYITVKADFRQAR